MVERTSQWVKVSFYGLVPDDQAVLDEVDVPVLANQLGLLFGFSHVDQLQVQQFDGSEASPESVDRSVPADSGEEHVDGTEE